MRFSIFFTRTSVLRFQTEAHCLLNYHYGQIASYLFVTLQKDDILGIINDLESNKSYDHDEISICLLEICDDSICWLINKSLKLLCGLINFLCNGKKLILLQFIKNMKVNCYKLPSYFTYQFVVKYLNDLFMTKCLSFLENDQNS